MLILTKFAHKSTGGISFGKMTSSIINLMAKIFRAKFISQATEKCLSFVLLSGTVGKP